MTETPLTRAHNLSKRHDCEVLLKREDLQPVFSFKLRGAYNKMAHLDAEQRWRGVVACSAGKPFLFFPPHSPFFLPPFPVTFPPLNPPRLMNRPILKGV